MARFAFIHWVDFTSNLDRTACGDELDTELVAGDGMPVTVFMSSATCPACRSKIDAKIERAFGHSGVGASAASTTRRISSSDIPPERSAVTP